MSQAMSSPQFEGRKMKLYLEKVWVRRLISLLLLTALWEILARIEVINPFYAPPSK